MVAARMNSTRTESNWINCQSLLELLVVSMFPVEETNIFRLASGPIQVSQVLRK